MECKYRISFDIGALCSLNFPYRFLLANIHLELLSRYNNRNVLRRALHYLPQSLNEAYGEAMKQVVSLNPCVARHIYWTLYALRPLSVSELKHATKAVDLEEKPESMSFEQSLQIETAGLLTIDAMTGTVRFAHKTAREYLKGTAARVFFPNAQKDIAETCLTAITPDEVIDDCYISGNATDSRNKGKGFLSYAAIYWGYHAREVAEGEPSLQVLIGTFLNKFLWRRPPPKKNTIAKEMPTELGLGKYPDDWSAMHILAFFGILGKSKRLLEQGTNVNMNDNSLKVTPLHCAVSRGNDKMVDFLLENGVDGNAVSKDGNTALHMATQNGQRKVMKLLLSQPVNSQIANSHGARSLQLAVGTATDEATVPLLVKNRAGVNSQDLRTGDTALHLAVKWRRPRITLFLLEKGAAMNMTNADGITPLQLAAQLDNCEAISLLLQRGAQVEARSLGSLTALQIAAQKKHWIAFDLLLIGGADINAWTTEGDTLLHEHARESFSSISIAAKLLDQGMNIEARSSQGYTPLQCAVISRNKRMAMFLLSQGANVDVLTPKGESLLHIMTPLNNDCLEISKAVLDQGLDVNAVSSQGWTALHQTVYTGAGALDIESDKTREFIKLLLDYGADINTHTVSAIAETPLHLAIRANIARPSLVSLLISLGADINAMNNEGKTPLHLAGERGRESIFRILLGAGADLSLEIPECNPTDADTAGDGPVSAGSTAFDLARKNPFSILWFDDEGMLRPAPEKKRRDSIGTVIEDMDSEDSEDDMAGSTLVGSEKQFVMV